MAGKESSNSKSADLDLGAFVAFLAVSGLWSLAVAYPVFENITSGPEGVTMVHADWLDVVLLVVAVLLLPPLVLTLVVLAVRQFVGSPPALVVLSLILGCLVSLLLWQYLKVRPPLEYVLPYLGGFLSALVIFRTVFARTYFAFLGLATPVVLVLFLITPQVSSELRPAKEPRNEVISTTSEHSKASVVLVIFDEFPLAALTNSKGRIDGRLFPNFAQLGNQATFFPRAISNSPATLHAVPAIMTGTKPPTSTVPPSEKLYPSNLCNLLDSVGWSVRSSETRSRFCNRNYPRRDRFETLVSVGTTGGAFPTFVEGAVSAALGNQDSTLRNLLDRRDEFESFLNGLGSGPRRLEILHTLLPHEPWNLNELCQFYLEPSPAPDNAAGARSRQLAQDIQFQLLMIQAKCLDNWIGRLVAKLKESGDWNETMLVITADHGRAFRGSGSARAPTRETSADIARVPLFIKHPGQRSGKRDTRLVRSVDIVPTILADLGVRVSGGFDGMNLRAGGKQRAEQEITLWNDPKPYKFSLHEINRSFNSMVRQRERLFGNGTLYALGGDERVLGSMGNGSALKSEIAEDLLDLFFGVPGANTAGFQAEVTGVGVRAGRPVAVTYDREVLATARIYKTKNGRFNVSTVLPVDGGRQRSPGGEFEVLRLGW